MGRFNRDQPAIAAKAMSLLLALLIGLCFQRNLVWEDDLLLWEDTISKSPDRDRVAYNLGNVYAKIGAFSEALDLFNRTIVLNPSYVAAYHKRGNIYDDLGSTDRALLEYERVIKMAPAYSEVHYDYGLVYERLGKFPDAAAEYAKGCSRGDQRSCAAEQNLGQRR